MKITGLVITSPAPAATRTAWRRLGTSGVDVEITTGEGGLAAVVLGVDDVHATERLLRRRGLVGNASGFDLAGLSWRLAPMRKGVAGTGVALDHVVVRTRDAELAAANYGARLGLDLRLDRSLEEHGFRGLFFRCGGAVVEVVAPTKGGEGPDSFGGLAWRVSDLESSRERLVAEGVEVSPIRTGRKPGTRVATVRDLDLMVPTLLISAT